MNKAGVSQKLIALRRQKGLSQEQLANQSGVALRTVQRIEAAAVAAHLQTLSLLAKTLAVDVSEFTSSQITSINETTKNWLMLLHLSPIIGSAFPGGSLLVPLALWFYKRNDAIEFDNHGRSIVNFQITMLIVYLVSFACIVLLNLFPAMLILAGSIVLNVVLIFYNLWRVWKNQTWGYPLAIPFLKAHHDYTLEGS
jgi:D-alanyl-D-alanine-carboxypeptidase/D-alanyl-D-alanine-endopeptidase